MRKVLKFGAILFGAIALITGASSCKKDEKVASHECCTFTDSFGDTYKYCEDDSYIQNSGYTWSYFKSYWISDYGVTCKDEAIL